MTLHISRETILVALYQRLKVVSFSQPVRGKTTFTITSRRLKHWADVARADRPALFMTCHGENPLYRSESTPSYQKFDVKIFVYLDTGEVSPNYTPDTDISVILDALDSSISPGVGEQRQTLGGLVSHCRVDGEILRDPGDIDGDGIIIYPISVTTT